MDSLVTQRRNAIIEQRAANIKKPLQNSKSAVIASAVKQSYCRSQILKDCFVAARLAMTEFSEFS